MNLSEKEDYKLIRASLDKIKLFQESKIDMDGLILHLEESMENLKTTSETWKEDFMYPWGILEVKYSLLMSGSKKKFDEKDIVDIHSAIQNIILLLNHEVQRIKSKI